jgi:hypothetical protein
MKRWLAVLLLMFGGLGAEAVQPGPCQLVVNTRTGRYPNGRGDRDDHDGRDGRDSHDGRGGRGGRDGHDGRDNRNNRSAENNPKWERRRGVF